MSPVPASIAAQTVQARALLERHLGPALRAIHLFGSAVDGGLQACSDIDLLVAVSGRPCEATRRALLLDLLAVSAQPGQDAGRRALEVTVLALDEVVPWRYPARRELQFGEWLRQELQAGVVEPPMPDPDLAILLTQARQHGIALAGPAAQGLFEPVPRQDFMRALADTLAQWNTPADWEGDERNIVLALARIWFSAATGRIARKDAAAHWLLPRLPAQHRPVLQQARAAYRGSSDARLAAQGEHIAAFIRFARAAIAALPDMAALGSSKTGAPAAG